MRDVSAKIVTLRTATAEATLRLSPETILAIKENRTPKPDPLSVARVAGIQGAKNTPLLIPYCHTIPLDHAGIEYEIGTDTIRIFASAKAIARTGVEMEALAGVSAAVLTLYDMLKPIDDFMSIENVTLTGKIGGKSDHIFSGSWTAGIIVSSDRAARGIREDKSGQILTELFEERGATAVVRVVVEDEVTSIQKALSELCEVNDLVVITGGTGVAPRDVTPEAVIPLLDKRLPGIEEQYRSYSQNRIPTAMLSRSVAGMIGKCLVLAIPGSPGAVTDAVISLFPHVLHALDIRTGASHE